MASTVREYLIKAASIKSATTGFKTKIGIVGDLYSTLAGVKKASASKLNAQKNLEGAPLFKPFTEKEIALFDEIKKGIDPNKSIEENFIKLLTAHFIDKQLLMLQKLNLVSITTNPLLCSALKMDTVEELVKFNVYAATARSIVTSMGYLIENLLLYSNPDVKDGKEFDEGESNKWDLVIERLDSVRCYIEVKSGPNDLDKTQIKSYNKEIKAVEAEGYKGFIGISYGRKDIKTVTTDLLPNYLDEWESHTLIGTELWDFVSGNPSYHEQLMAVIKETASKMLRGKSIVRMIERRVKALTKEFNEKYSSIDDYFAQLW